MWTGHFVHPEAHELWQETAHLVPLVMERRRGSSLETTRHSVGGAGRVKLGAKAEHGTVVPGMPFP